MNDIWTDDCGSIHRWREESNRVHVTRMVARTMWVDHVLTTAQTPGGGSRLPVKCFRSEMFRMTARGTAVRIWTDTALWLVGHEVLPTATPNNYRSSSVAAVSPPVREDIWCGRNVPRIPEVVGCEHGLNPGARCGSGRWCLEVGVATTVPPVDRIPRVNVSVSTDIYSFGFEGKRRRIVR